MKRYLLDTGIAACQIDRGLGVCERGKAETSTPEDKIPSKEAAV